MKTCLQPHPLRIRNSPQSASCFATKAGLKWEGVTCRRVSGEGKKQEQRLEFRISFNFIRHRLTQALHLPCVCVRSLGFCSHICEIQAELKCVFHSCVACPHQLDKTSLHRRQRGLHQPQNFTQVLLVQLHSVYQRMHACRRSQ